MVSANNWFSTGTAQSNPTFNLEVGDTLDLYNTGIYTGHPIYFKTAPTTGTGDLVASGAYGQGADGGSLYSASAGIDTTGWTPGTYYYQCGNHAGMGGQIIVHASGSYYNHPLYLKTVQGSGTGNQLTNGGAISGVSGGFFQVVDGGDQETRVKVDNSLDRYGGKGISFYTSCRSQLIVDSTGNVGIGIRGLGDTRTTPCCALHVGGTNAVKLPVGNTAQRPYATNTAAHAGFIRYNYETNHFEGYGAGDNWGTLGGVMDVDLDTFVKAESTPGDDNDELWFETAGQRRMTIKNDGNRLSQEDIEKMVKEAEKFKDEDDKLKEKIDAVNQYEALLYQTKSTLDKKEVSEKLTEEDKNTVTAVITEHETWLNDNREMTDKEMIEQKTKEFQDIISPIMSKLYQGNGGGGMPDMSNMGSGMEENEMPSSNSGVTIDEVD